MMTDKILFVDDDQMILRSYRTLPAKEIETGMMLAEDLRTRDNVLLLAKRQEVSEMMRLYILKFSRNKKLVEPIKILSRAE